MFWIVVEALFMCAAEMAGFYSWTGNPFFRFSATSTIYGPTGSFANPFTFREAVAYVCDASNSLGDLGIYGYLLFIAVLMALNRRSVKTVFPLVVCAVLAVYLSVGSASLTHYLIVPHQPRYLHLVMVMGCTLVAIEFCETAGFFDIKRTVLLLAGAAFAVVSLLAAKESVWRGTVPAARWLAGFDAATREKLALLESLVDREPLECRKTAMEFAVIADCENGEERQFLSESIDKISLGHGLVVDRFKWVARPGQEDYENLELSLLRSTHPFFREERIYGPGWPPYRAWFGFGEQKRMIGRIWWACQDTATEGKTKTGPNL